MDAVVIVIVSWCGILGWKRGAVRALVDAFSWLISIFVITQYMPILGPVFLSPALQDTIDRFITQHLTTTTPHAARIFAFARAIPVGASQGGLSEFMAHRIYQSVLTASFAVSIFFGIQIMLNIYGSVREPQGLFTATQPILGSVIGVLLGIYVATFFLSTLVLICWFHHMQILDSTLVNSVTVHLLSWILA